MKKINNYRKTQEEGVKARGRPSEKFLQWTNFLIYSYMQKPYSIYVKRIIQFITCKILYRVAQKK